MSFNRLKFISIYIILSFAFIHPQSVYFIKYKETIPSVKIDELIETKKIFPSLLNKSISNEVEIIKAGYFAKGLGKDHSELSRIVKLIFKNDDEADKFLSSAADDNAVEYVQKSIRYRLDFMPNDSAVAQQWGLEKIRAFDAWNTTMGEDSIILAIIDTGMDYFHPDLKNKIYFNSGEIGFDAFGRDKRFNGIDDDGNGFIDDYMGWDFTDRTGFPFDTSAGDYLNWDNDPFDEHGHGTFIAGIAAAETDNQIGIAGAAPNIKVLNLRAFDPGGYGEEDDVAAAILYAIEMGAKVINMSFGDSKFSYVLRDVIKYAHKQNIVMVASSGNSASDAAHYPSGFTEVISVGSSTVEDYVSGNSNFGSTLDLVAPGSSILTTGLNNSYTNVSGTSASAPFVSATAALILSLGSFTNDEVKQIIKSTANDINSPGWDTKSGAGRLNMHKALSVLAPGKIKFNYPWQDFATKEDTLNIFATVLSPYFIACDLLLGEGENPTVWTEIKTNIKNQFSNEKLAIIDLTNFNEGVYTVRLIVYMNDGRLTEERINFHVQRKTPDAELVGFGTVYSGQHSTILAEIYTDQIAVSKMFYRKQGTSEFRFITLDGFAVNNQFVKNLHFGFLPVSIVEPNTFYEIYFEIENLAGLKTILKDGQNYFLVKTYPFDIPWTNYEMPFSLPKGTIFPDPVRITTDTDNEILFNEFYPGQILYYKLLRFDGEKFLTAGDSIKNKIPRSITDFNNNGKKELISSFERNGYFDEQISADQFQFSSLYSDSSGDFFPILVDDLTGNGIPEIVTITKEESIGIWNISNSGKPVLNQKLGNYSPIDTTFGLSNYLTRNVVIADCNNDGVKELWFLDRDGDLFSYNINNGNFTKGFSIATDFTSRFNNTISVGDYDGDGVDDIAVILNARSIAPYQLVVVFNYKDNKLNLITEIVFIDQSAEFQSMAFLDVFNSLRFVDVNNDGKHELVVNLFPHAYVFKREGLNDKIIFYKEGINTPAIFSGDLNSNGVTEIALQAADGIKFYEFEESKRAAVPVEMKGFSISADTIKLMWKGEADKYFIYRSQTKNEFTLIDSSLTEEYYDGDVSVNENYYYKIQSYKADKENQYSALSEALEVYSHAPAKLILAESQSANTVLIKFSERISSSITNLQSFNVLSFEYPNSISAASQYSYLLTFNCNLPEGLQMLTCKDLSDFFGSPIANDTVSFIVQEEKGSDDFYIASYELIDPFSLQINLNLAADPVSAMNIGNYKFNPENFISHISIDENNPAVLYLFLEKKRPIGSVGIEYKLKLENIFSSNATGYKKINSGAGSLIVIRSFAENLADVYVYPSPVKLNSNGTNKITFANLPQRATISIWNLNGERIIDLEARSGTGGLEYDLRDKSGQLLNSGIYIFRIVRLDNSNNELEEKMGKFAVIR
jgi:subtilisin family serine protease